MSFRRPRKGETDMARPQKCGVDYFPLDTVLDTKFELIEAEFGLTGFAVIVKIFQKIYGEFGYYCEWTDEVALLFSHKCGGGKVVSEIVSAAIRRGIFDKDMYDKYSILTSKGIQERYFEAVNRRVNVDVKNEYLLVCAADLPENVNINKINVNKNPENVNRNSQSKVNKTKLYKIKLNKKIDTAEQSINQSEAIDASVKAYEKYIGIVTPKVYEELNYYLSQGMDTDLVVRLIEYVAEQPPAKHSWQYLNAVLNGTLESGILTLDNYNRIRADYVAGKVRNVPVGGKKNKFNNYQSSAEGATDYEALEQSILDNMLDNIDN